MVLTNDTSKGVVLFALGCMGHDSKLAALVCET